MPPEGLRPGAYFETGLELLAERGFRGLTIAALCERLGVTKGSFYHHFSDMAEFVDQLLEHWAREHASRLIALSESVTDPTERYDLLEGIAVGLPHGAEAAIRAWSWTNEAVASAQRKVDAMRLDHLTTSGVEAGESPERARLMALISLGTLVGLQQLERPPSVESMRQVFAELRSWVRADTGA
ncbi:MAG TPA: helix-turn-helix domain-containing protein [Acidimicrobiales bacterium]|nr:helix-turn-helix domain-containing protein [Acidimicrobiales bacterium]